MTKPFTSLFEFHSHHDEWSCGVCGGEVVPLGTMGNLEHGRCRQCGMEMSQPVSSSFSSEEETPLEMAEAMLNEFRPFQMSKPFRPFKKKIEFNYEDLPQGINLSKGSGSSIDGPNKDKGSSEFEYGNEEATPPEGEVAPMVA